MAGPKVQNLYEYVDAIRIRPGMYIGENSLSAMYFHIGGYLTACDLKGIEETLTPEFHTFHDFVAKYYSYRESTAGWKNIILKEKDGNEQEALTEFYKLFDLFRQGTILPDTLIK
jgi:hypothetical protein